MMGILSGEEPLIDRLMREFNRPYETPSGGASIFGIPSSALPAATPVVSAPAARIGVQTPVADTPPIPPTVGSPPVGPLPAGLPLRGPSPTFPGPFDLPPPTSPVPAMDKPTYEYAGNGLPFTDPVTVGPDPRSDLSSEAGLAWLAKVRPNLSNTPAGPATATIDTLRGGYPGMLAFYSPEQVAQQRATGLNLVGSPFEWNQGNTAQLNAALAQRFNAQANAEYLRRKGEADVAVAKAAEAGKLAMYDPQRQETERLLEAGRQNPMLWQTPEFKQKVGVPLTGPEKLAMAQAAYPGMDVAGGIRQLTEGYAPGTSGLARFFDASRFGMSPLTPGQKIQRALESMPSGDAAQWRRVAEILGLIDMASGQSTRKNETPR